ncbi:hypothetical protein EV658_104143 [Phaeovulum veldkampii DSM 11550]|nr:hypothetical protein EV658_104143 [Phaeovulum veldkampii DSM 11550]
MKAMALVMLCGVVACAAPDPSTHAAVRLTPKGLYVYPYAAAEAENFDLALQP